MEQIGQNIEEIRQNIEIAAKKSGRTADDITLIAVTKTVDVDSINYAIGCGIKNIGENRVQEMLYKYDNINKSDLNFHLIGHLQTNKVKYIIDKVSLIQSVDSLKLAEEINKCAEKANLVAKILVEVNIGEEISKFGIKDIEIADFLCRISEFMSIKVRGLMAIPPINEDFEKTRVFFKRMYDLFIDIKAKKLDNISMDFLSMGMSGDYIPAIEEGSNMVRLGTSIFGSRHYNM